MYYDSQSKTFEYDRDENSQEKVQSLAACRSLLRMFNLTPQKIVVKGCYFLCAKEVLTKEKIHVFGRTVIDLGLICSVVVIS